MRPSSLTQTCLAVAVSQSLALPTEAAFIPVSCDAASLISAVTTANGNAEPDELNITLGGSCTITLVSVDNTANGDNGLPGVYTEITINGNGATIMRDNAAPDFRFFNVGTGANLVLNDLILSGGHANSQSGGAIRAADPNTADAYNVSLSIQNTTISGNRATGSFPDGLGGGIFASSTYLSIGNGSTVSGNTAGSDGGGLAATGNRTLELNDCVFSGNSSGQSGGGINIASNESAGISNCTISNNRADLDGGALYVTNSPGFTLSGSTITGNTADDSGGAVSFNESEDATVTSVTLTGNDAGASGGGIFVYGYGFSLIDSTLTGNSADSNGGGIFLRMADRLNLVRSTIAGNHSETRGGGVSTTLSDKLNIENTTVSGNSADIGGGGVHISIGDTMTLVNSTITHNSAVLSGGGILLESVYSVDLVNTIISGNSAPVNGDEISVGVSSFAAISNNLLGHDGIANSAEAFYNFTPDVSDITATVDGNQPTALKAMFGPLDQNGGPTRTHGLVPGSPALDAGDNTNCGSHETIATDQRGEPRDDGKCDIGAVEGVVDNGFCFAVQLENGGTGVICL